MAIFYFITKKPTLKKRLKITIIIMAVIFTNGALYGTVLRWWQPEAQVQHHNKKFNTAIMLTGLTMGNSKKERFFGGGPNDRFIQTARLYHTGTVQNILISGGSGSLKNDELLEADFLKEEFIAMGIPAQNIILEKRSRNTYESAVAAKPILDSLHALQSCILVTSAMHMPRSEATFRKAGIPVETHIANFEVLEIKISPGSFIPDLTLLNSWQYLLKELSGMAVYKLTGKA